VGRGGSSNGGVSGIEGRCRQEVLSIEEAGMTDVEAVVQRYYGDRPVMQRIEDALRGAGVDPERPSHRDLWPFRPVAQPGYHGNTRACGTCAHTDRHVRARNRLWARWRVPRSIACRSRSSALVYPRLSAENTCCSARR